MGPDQESTNGREMKGMQIDFHYHATYAMARAAGLRREPAQRIATAAQFVDDAVDEDLPGALQGKSYAPIVTAHRVEDPRNTAITSRTGFEDQQFIWVPFHFLPGGQGSSVSEKLVCLMDGSLAKDVQHLAVSRVKSWNGPELLGVTAHVIADTFSHHGFSGVSSRRNRVDGTTITARQAPQGVARLVSDAVAAVRQAAESGGLCVPNWRELFASAMNMMGALGHGAVDVLPDQPYLLWAFEYEGYQERPRQASGDRNNPLDFLMAARRLYELFSTACARGGSEVEDPDGRRPFRDLERALAELVWTVGSKGERCNRWATAAQSGALYNGSDSIPEYAGAAMRSSARALLNTSTPVHEEPAARFFEAARTHQQHVLDVLLPRFGIRLRERT
jgi:hypothetical protein